LVIEALQSDRVRDGSEGLFEILKGLADLAQALASLLGASGWRSLREINAGNEIGS
jgi:hypothetical protein